MSATNLSPNQKALRKFLKNPFGMTALVLIVLMSLLALFAYGIAPDHTPQAN